MTTADNGIHGSDLADLVNYPRETLDIELKEWMNLTDRVAQAKLAKHIAALANHGGGYLVFGFCDDLSAAPNRPHDLSLFSRDQFSMIVKRYLSPNFQCEVVLVRSSSGHDYPVVRVPSHGNTPIAAKSDGPHDSKGQPQGIKLGTYYIRKTGPESAAALGAEDWQPLLRRCLLADRDNLLTDVARVLQPRAEPNTHSTENDLQRWHENSEARWRNLVEQTTQFHWLTNIELNHCQLSYNVQFGSGVTIPSIELRQVLEEVNGSVRQTVWTGWSMFYPFTQPEIAAAFFPEFNDGSGLNVLESNLIGDGDFDISLPDYWRFAVDGRATIIRPYREDRQRSVVSTGREAGTWLSPETVIRETVELITHARSMAERFDGSSVEFRCTWRGLGGRKIDDFDGIYWSPGRVAQATQRTTTGRWDIPYLTANWHSVAAELACPVLSLFGFNECGPGLVEGLAPRFIKI
jgi:hypothetical protein